jgi:hypothetical protein
MGSERYKETEEPQRHFGEDGQIRGGSEILVTEAGKDVEPGIQPEEGGCDRRRHGYERRSLEEKPRDEQKGQGFRDVEAYPHGPPVIREGDLGQ